MYRIQHHAGRQSHRVRHGGLLDAKFTALQSTLFRNVVPAIIEAINQPTLDTFKQ